MFVHRSLPAHLVVLLIGFGIPNSDVAAQDGESWVLRFQLEDGRISAAEFPGSDANGAGAGRPERDLRATALVALSVLADGSTLRSGPHRVPLRRAVNWLRRQQDGQGRLGLQTEPDWIVDHAIGTYALCEAARASRYALLRDHVGPALAALIEHLRHFDAGVAPELLLWCRISALSAARFEVDLRGGDRDSGDPAWHSGADLLLTQVDRLMDDSVPESSRQRAAQLLLRATFGVPAADSEQRETLRQLAAPFTAVDQPATDCDPLTWFYVGCALYRLAADAEGKSAWGIFEQRTRTRIVDTQLTAGDWMGTWEPAGEFGADGGRPCTTATNVICLTLYYRYCGLGVAGVVDDR